MIVGIWKYASLDPSFLLAFLEFIKVLWGFENFFIFCLCQWLALRLLHRIFINLFFEIFDNFFMGAQVVMVLFFDFEAIKSIQSRLNKYLRSYSSTLIDLKTLRILA